MLQIGRLWENNKYDNMISNILRVLAQRANSQGESQGVEIFQEYKI